jgi:hypothetical protein
MIITIQELHTYKHLVDLELAPPIPCPINSDHTDTIPWFSEDEKVFQLCLACNTKIYLSQDAMNAVKYLIYKNRNYKESKEYIEYINN